MIGSKQLTWVLAGAALLAALAPAAALEVPPFRGNDTGGIIAYDYSRQFDVRALAGDHCGQYDKIAKFTGADRRYGGYISFNCVWVRSRPIRAMY